MGEDALGEAGIQKYQVLYHFTGESSALDTREAAQTFLKDGVDLILFCGGDGTARHIFDAVGRNCRFWGFRRVEDVLGGICHRSGYSSGDRRRISERIARDFEVMDVDEDAYRAGELKTRLHGIARTPALEGKVQFP